MQALQATVEGIGFWGSGLPDWDSACAWVRTGQRPDAPPARPAPQLLAANERRRAPGTVVVGDINTNSDLRVLGEVKGNLKVATKLELNGKVIGDIEADEAAIANSLIRGNLTVRNLVTLDADTTVVGDVSARNAEINGKVKGNLTVDERGHFKTNATLVGNLISGTVIIDEGAMLKGDIAITNAQYEDISVEEPEFDIEIG